ncbi:MAG: hypothetical protein B7C54_02460 [Acidimicrobiales bacterium mtb01]|nr:hypothetical protein [Actinomycetota bacterium]TEX47939.1 MAG: hypothetical protein B7C54_02460 [Acidimicrobiales bacterium mtb01]
MTTRRSRTPIAATAFLIASLAIATVTTGSSSDSDPHAAMGHGMPVMPDATTDATTESDEASAEAIDPTTKDQVLEQIERAGLYVLDVDNIDVHIHVQFYVQVNGVTQVIPQTGVDFDTLTAAPIHTHDLTGILHIENDTNNPEVPTIADFLEVWTGTSTERGLCSFFLGKASCYVAAYRNGQFFALDDPLRDVDTVVLYVNDNALV